MSDTPIYDMLRAVLDDGVAMPRGGGRLTTDAPRATRHGADMAAGPARSRAAASGGRHHLPPHGNGYA